MESLARNLLIEAWNLDNNIGDNFTTESQWKYVKLLNMLIKANSVAEANSETKYEILRMMALTNYNLLNYNIAYNCAIIAKDIAVYLNRVYSNKDGFIEDINNIIDRITNAMNPEKPTLLMEEYVVNECCTLQIRKSNPLKYEAPFSKNTIYEIIDILKYLARNCYKNAEYDGNWMQAEKSAMLYNIFKYPLLFVWQKYMFGKDEEVWDEGEDMLRYMMFVKNINHHVPELISLLTYNQPFAIRKHHYDKDRREDLLQILTDLNKWLKRGLK